MAKEKKLPETTAIATPDYAIPESAKSAMNLITGALSAATDFDKNVVSESIPKEDGTTIEDTYLIVESNKNGEVILRDKKTISWIAAVKKLDAVNDKGGLIRCCALSDMRKSESFKKCGYSTFGKFAKKIFPEYDEKSLGLWANIGDAFLQPVYDKDDETIVIDVIPIRGAFRGFRVGSLQILLALANDEKFGIDFLTEAIINGDINSGMTDSKLKEWAVATRKSGKDGDKDGEKDGEKDGGKGKDGEKESAKKFDCETATADEFIGIIENNVVSLGAMIGMLYKRKDISKGGEIHILTDFKAAIDAFIENMDKLEIIDIETPVESPESGEEATESGEA